ncbi:peroxiredoxin-like family protein [Streptomyces sp. NBC_00344]|uniref:peroxiredoxin-like family protein n=1 Tax=Streptomyces sp. NBC_00344 TaxID=2975720 RepID=UPI002E1FA5D4
MKTSRNTPSGHHAPAASHAEHHYAPGDTVGSRELTTIHGRRVSVPAPGLLTHLQFRRFAGCPFCNTHLRSIAVRHNELVDAGIFEVAVFHSSAKAMLPHHDGLPFAVVPDPEKTLYAAFGVGSSKKAVFDPRVWPTAVRGFPDGWRGNRAGRPSYPTEHESVFGLPADFLISGDGTVLAAKYGRNALDHWSVGELLALAANHTG